MNPKGQPVLIRASAVLPDGVLEDARVLIQDGVITGIHGPTDQFILQDGPPVLELDFGDGRLLPGFIDLHVHGGAGRRIAAEEEAGHDAVAAVSRYLATTGTTAFLPTLATAPDDVLFGTLGEISGLTDSDTAGARVLGAHLEGPYLNPVRKGAMNAELFRDPSPAHFHKLREASQDTIRYVTLAPERSGALEFIADLSARGIIASAGHTDATAGLMEEAFAAGLSVVTHLFNAMRGIHHREPGVAGVALTRPGITVELIADGYHVDPVVMSLAIRARGTSQVAVITDGGSFMGQPEGSVTQGGRTVTSSGGRVTLQDGTLAGSASPMNRNCTVLRNLGLDWTQIAEMTSLTPASVLGLEDRFGSIREGREADLTVLDEQGTVLMTMIGGNVRHGQGSTALPSNERVIV